jgi:hypothetical protein
MEFGDSVGETLTDQLTYLSGFFIFAAAENKRSLPE